MARNTSISLGNHFEQFIKQEISTGRFNNASEVIRTALRMLESEEQKLHALRKALVAGEESGTAESFDPESHLSLLKASKK